MKIVQTILAQIDSISKPQQKFLLILFSTLFIVCGKVNFTNLSRYSKLSEKTYRRQFSQPFNFLQFNQNLIKYAINQSARKIAVIDCSFIPKSGKQTYGKDYFFNGCVGQPEKGLEISLITVVDVDANLGYTLSVKQTPARDKKTRVPGKNYRRQTKSQKSSKRQKSTQSHKRKQKLDSKPRTGSDKH